MVTESPDGSLRLLSAAEEFLASRERARVRMAGQTAFHEAVMTYGKEDTGFGRAARKLDNALNALSLLTPEQRLGFLIRAEFEIERLDEQDNEASAKAS